ncbi:MAG: hypothetical protein MUP76_03810 [Acidimicrobiia bacterium]|nr:hypothetical protein [Acidimicrobiia bacterium]
MRLSAPKNITFFIAIALIAFGLIAHFTDIVDIKTDVIFLVTAGGGVLLALGCWLKGL